MSAGSDKGSYLQSGYIPVGGGGGGTGGGALGYMPGISSGAFSAGAFGGPGSYQHIFEQIKKQKKAAAGPKLIDIFTGAVQGGGDGGNAGYSGYFDEKVAPGFTGTTNEDALKYLQDFFLNKDEREGKDQAYLGMYAKTSDPENYPKGVFVNLNSFSPLSLFQKALGIKGGGGGGPNDPMVTDEEKQKQKNPKQSRMRLMSNIQGKQGVTPGAQSLGGVNPSSRFVPSGIRLPKGHPSDLNPDALYNAPVDIPGKGTFYGRRPNWADAVKRELIDPNDYKNQACPGGACRGFFNERTGEREAAKNIGNILVPESYDPGVPGNVNPLPIGAILPGDFADEIADTIVQERTPNSSLTQFLNTPRIPTGKTNLKNPLEDFVSNNADKFIDKYLAEDAFDPSVYSGIEKRDSRRPLEDWLQELGSKYAQHIGVPNPVLDPNDPMNSLAPFMPTGDENLPGVPPELMMGQPTLNEFGAPQTGTEAGGVLTPQNQAAQAQGNQGRFTNEQQSQIRSQVEMARQDEIQRIINSYKMFSPGASPETDSSMRNALQAVQMKYDQRLRDILGG